MELIGAALDLWHGPAASGIDPHIRGQAVFTALDREYLATAREAADLALTAGVPDRLLPALRSAAERGPFDEPETAEDHCGCQQTQRKHSQHGWIASPNVFTPHSIAISPTGRRPSFNKGLAYSRHRPTFEIEPHGLARGMAGLRLPD